MSGSGGMEHANPIRYTKKSKVEFIGKGGRAFVYVNPFRNVKMMYFIENSESKHPNQTLLRNKNIYILCISSKKTLL